MAVDPLAELLGGVLRGAGHGQAEQYVQNSGHDALQDLLGGILGGGAGQATPQQQSGGDAITDILGSVLGGAAQQRPQQQPSGGGIADILGSILGGGGAGQASPQQRPQQQPSGGGIADILGSILGGGGAGQAMPQQQSSGDPLTDILGGILGSGASPMPQQQPRYPTPGGSYGGGGGILDIIGSLIGGSLQGGASGLGAQGGGLMDLIAMMMGANQMGGLGAIAGTPFAPIITALAKKLGINPIIASIVVGFLLKKLFESQSRPQQAQRAMPNQRMPQQGGGLDSLIDRFGSGKSIDRNYIHQSGMADELSQASGLSPQDATNALQSLIGMLGGGSGAQGQQQQSDLKGLLDSWK